MIIIPGQPQGKARARIISHNGINRSYTPKQTTEHERLIALCYRAQGGKYHADKPIKLTVAAFYNIPKSWSKKAIKEAEIGLILPTVKPDCDNCIKIIADALNKIAYEDDKQIISISIHKYYSHEPRLEIEVTSV